MNMECTICKKKYKNVDALARHRSKCILINPNFDIIMRETKDIPYTRAMLTALFNKVTELEKKVEMNTKYIKREKKKINIIEFLNELEKKHSLKTQLPTFNSLKQDINIDNTTIKEYLTAQSPLSGLVNIVIQNLNNYSEDEVPIRCFSQKRSVFYIRVQNETKDKYYWVELTDTPEYERLIMNIQQKLLREYEKIHNNKIMNSSEMNQTSQVIQTGKTNQDKYFENIKKILITDQSSETVCKYFKHKLYESLKREVDIKYEIVF